MRHLCLILILALQAMPALSAQLQNGSIEGIVLNSTTREPISKAQITVYGENNSTWNAVSNEAGRFIVTNLTAGRYRILAEHNLFLEEEHRGEFVVSLKPGEIMQGFRVELVPKATISGRVVDEDRRPRAGVSVQAWRYSYSCGKRQLLPDARYKATTDGKGNYEIRLAPGNWFIRAVPSEPRWERPTYYPFTQDPQSAIPVSVAPGAQSTGIDIRLGSTTRPKPVRLKLAAPHALQPEDIVRIGLRDSVEWYTDIEGFGSRQIDIDRIGSDEFRLGGLPSGTYDLRVIVGAPDPFSLSGIDGFMRAEIKDTSESEIDLGVLPLRESVPVVVQINIAEDPGSRRNFSWQDVKVFASPIDGPPACAQPPFGPVVDRGTEGKTATLRVPPFGRYVIGMSYLPSGAAVTSVRYQGREILGSGLLLDEELTVPVEITVSGAQALGTVSGIVHNAKLDPAVRSTVLLIPDPAHRQNPSLFVEASTDNVGAFVMKNVLPGDYTLVAWEDVDRAAWSDTDFLKEYESRGTRITVRARLETTQDLQVVPVK